MESQRKNSDLKVVQRWMQEALITSDNPANKNSIIAHIKGSKNLSATESLAIYQRSYYSRLVQCLKEQYKALCFALGEDLFTDFSRTYLKSYPSNSPTLSDLGGRFPHFLEETRPDAHELEKADWVEFMIDLAKYEWDLYKMFDAPGAEGNLYATEITSDANLTLQKCFKIKKYKFPVSVYYRAVAQKNKPDIPPPQQSFVALSRKNFEIRVTLLLEPQYFFLQQLTKNNNIQSALEATAKAYDRSLGHVHQSWMKWKPKWVAAGFFISA